MALRLTELVFIVALLTGYMAETAKKFRILHEQAEKEQNFWYSLAREDLDVARNREWIEEPAKNVVIFLGDGMGITVTTAARIHKGQQKGFSGEEESLVWDKFPNVALSKTYNVDKQVADSAASATAYLGGVKGNYYTVGVTANVKVLDCEASLRPENRVASILQWSQEAGKDTGFVTTTRVTHASPAALYAHSAEREWECDAKLKKAKNSANCKDIAQQLVEDLPGRDINVIFAGGRRQMGVSLPGDGGSSCLRNDSRNLVEEWLAAKRENNHRAAYAKNNQEFRNLNVDELDYVMGLFGGSHMPYEYERDNGPEGVPSLKELTETAIRRLQRNPKGFFLFVEGGRIDHALHDTRPRAALDEVLAFEAAVEAALKMTDNEDTLIIVTADHSHGMTMNGYPDRGNDILGTTSYEYVTDGLEYTTLMFTTGNATNFTWTDGKVVRSDVSKMNTRDYDFMSAALVPTQFGYETHGGEDVGIHATGPMAHLFHRVHEQSYIAHVMGFASCVGPYKHDCLEGQMVAKAKRLSHRSGGVRLLPEVAITVLLLVSAAAFS